MDCEYCSQARLINKGAVYCSRHQNNIKQLPSGLFYFPPSDLESSEHTSRLSVRFSIGGKQQYKIGGREVTIDDDHYTVINCGQSYKVRHAGQGTLLGLAFNPGHASDILANLVTPDSALLTDPGKPFESFFIEGKHQITPNLRKYLSLIKNMMKDPVQAEFHNLSDIYTSVLAEVYQQQNEIVKNICTQLPLKKSTAIELYKRISLVKEYIDENPAANPTNEFLARLAAMSSYHFMRTFKKIYGVTPYQYQLERKLTEAHRCVSLGHQPVREIYSKLGFGSKASFNRLFKSRFGKPPTGFRGV